jgi:hypothetical protein
MRRNTIRPPRSKRPPLAPARRPAITNEPECGGDAYAQGLAERDEGVAEGDFVLRFLQDIGIALGKGRLIRLHPTSDGLEICSLYRSHAGP